MEPSPLKRRAAFGLIVVAFALLGAYLLGPVGRGPGRSGDRHITHLLGSRPGPARSPTATSPAPTGLDIYQWLPFTQTGLAAAASVVIRFGDAYGTFAYTETPAAYAVTMRAVTSGQLLAQIRGAFSTPGVASARVKARQLSVGGTAIEAIRAFGPTSLTFVVRITQRLTDLSGRSRGSTRYAVTVTGSGSSWQVSDVELASAGDS